MKESTSEAMKISLKLGRMKQADRPLSSARSAPKDGMNETSAASASLQRELDAEISWRGLFSPGVLYAILHGAKSKVDLLEPREYFPSTDPRPSRHSTKLSIEETFRPLTPRHTVSYIITNAVVSLTFLLL